MTHAVILLPIYGIFFGILLAELAIFFMWVARKANAGVRRMARALDASEKAQALP